MENKFCWQPLDLDKFQETQPCKICKQDMHLLKVNENIIFWVHQGKELEKCTMIAFKTSYLNGLKNLLEEKKKRLQENIREK